MTRLWWVRHGPTHAKSMVGWSDLAADLSDHAALARLSDYLPKDAAVVSSDLIRARGTADAIAAHRTRLPDLPALREIHFGDWELKRFDEIEAKSPDQIRAFWEQPGENAPPGGESWNQLRMRVDEAVEMLARQTGSGDLIVVAHFGVILTQLQRALGIDAYHAFSHKIDNLSVTQITFDGAWHAGAVNHIA